MKKLILIAGAAALSVAAPAVAKPGNGHGQGHGNANEHGHGYGMQGPVGYGAGGCPPGLAKKSPACVPPGQAKKMFGLGQRVPSSYQGLLGYNSVPYQLRNYYGSQLDPRSRYIYDNNYLYRVDPRTMLVQQILNGLIRP